MHPQHVLHHHVTGVIERGEKEPVVEQPVCTVRFCVVSTGTFATFVVNNVESTVRLPNGMKRPVRDLEDLADAEDSKAEAAARRAKRLRAAARSLAT